ncbi:TPA: ACT domain-containing protein [Candidatus Poribacteria bacterium]|nr:ACT domain-containing protein [Candidatus Poribacteria bacterium]
MAYQVSVFAENKPGRLGRITETLARANINLRAITITGTERYGVVKLLVDKPDLAYEVLMEAGFSVRKQEIIAILIDDVPGSLNSVLKVLAEKGVNIENAYGFLTHESDRAVFVFEVEDLKRTRRLLQEIGLRPLSDAEIAAL